MPKHPKSTKTLDQSTLEAVYFGQKNTSVVNFVFNLIKKSTEEEFNFLHYTFKKSLYILISFILITSKHQKDIHLHFFLKTQSVLRFQIETKFSLYIEYISLD